VPFRTGGKERLFFLIVDHWPRLTSKRREKGKPIPLPLRRSRVRKREGDLLIMNLGRRKKQLFLPGDLPGQREIPYTFFSQARKGTCQRLPYSGPNRGGKEESKFFLHRRDWEPHLGIYSF